MENPFKLPLMCGDFHKGFGKTWDVEDATRRTIASKLTEDEAVYVVKAIEAFDQDNTELDAVMQLGIDKWLEGIELDQTPANRAATAREKVLKIIEGLQKAFKEMQELRAKKEVEYVKLLGKYNALDKGSTWKEMYERSCVALSMIRETVEMLGVGLVISEEYCPNFEADAKAICDGIQKLYETNRNTK